MVFGQCPRVGVREIDITVGIFQKPLHRLIRRDALEGRHPRETISLAHVVVGRDAYSPVEEEREKKSERER